MTMKTPKTDSDRPDGLRKTIKCWLNYNPWLTKIASKEILDSAALFLGSRKTTYTEVSEIGVAFLKYSNKPIKAETQSINFSSWKLLVDRRFNNTIFSSPENLWN